MMVTRYRLCALAAGLCLGLLGCSGFGPPAPVENSASGACPETSATNDLSGGGVIVDRDIRRVEVLFGMDVSGSMADNQAASACVADRFIEAATQNGGDFSFGAVTSDPYGEHAGATATYDDDGAYRGPPGLVQLDGSCDRILSCSANGDCNDEVSQSPCRFTAEADADLYGYRPAAAGQPDEDAERLKQMLYMGEDGSGCEVTLYNLYLHFYDREINGLLEVSRPKMVVVVTDEDTSCQEGSGSQTVLNACPFGTFELPTPPGFSMPAATGDCEQDHINFFGEYFESRNIVVNALLFLNDPSNAVRCQQESTEIEGVIVKGVAEYTGGYVASLCDCASFGEFFEAVGTSTSALSTGLCFGNTLPDPDTITVTQVESGEIVPYSLSWRGGGWEIDSRMNCVVMSGSWAEVQGSFRVDFTEPPVRLDADGCLPPGTDPQRLDRIAVHCDGHAMPIPRSSGHGYSVEGSCLTLNGDYAVVDGCACTVTLL